MRGFTLLEALLACALGIVLLAVLIGALVPVLRYANWTSTRAALVQAASLACDRLGADLQKAPYSGLSLWPGLVGIHGVARTTDSAGLVWDDAVVLYQWKDGSLTRAEFRPGGVDLTGAPYRMAGGEIELALGQPATVKRRLVADVLKEFSLESEHGGLPLHLRVVAELPVAGKPPERFELKRDFTLRNGGDL